MTLIFSVPRLPDIFGILPFCHFSPLDCSGIDLENIVYYKDDTHYFVMTAKKNSLLKKGVIMQVRPGHTLNV